MKNQLVFIILAVVLIVIAAFSISIMHLGSPASTASTSNPTIKNSGANQYYVAFISPSNLSGTCGETFNVTKESVLNETAPSATKLQTVYAETYYVNGKTDEVIITIEKFENSSGATEQYNSEPYAQSILNGNYNEIRYTILNSSTSELNAYALLNNYILWITFLNKPANLNCAKNALFNEIDKMISG